jgi:tetratricopeptide (TPR) repeat protein
MHYAHARGIVHRDLKPHNVLLAPGADAAPGPPHLKITDFGLAKHLNEAAITQSGAIKGTPSYMAPEQARGRSGEIGPPADIYALGVILYEMLTGQPPFKGTTLLDTLEQVCVREPVPPSRLQPQVPRDLEIICLKCLEKDGRKRYPTALALAEDVRRFLNREPINARPAPYWERLWKWSRRHPPLAALYVVSLLALVACIAAGFTSARFEAQKAEIYKKKLEDVNFLKGVEEAIKQRWLQAEQHAAAKRWAEADQELDKAQAALDTQRDLRAKELRAEVGRLRAVVKQRRQEDEEKEESQDRLRRFQPLHEQARLHQTGFTSEDLPQARAKTRQAAQKALALYGLDQGPAAGATFLLEHARSHLSDDQYGWLVGACYELLLHWAEAEPDPWPGQDQAQARQQAGHALTLLARAENLGRAHGLRTRTYYFRHARYAAQARGEAFDQARVDPAVPAQPTGALDWFLEGLGHYQAGEFAKARQGCEEVLARENDHFWARYVLGLCHLRSGRWVEGKAELTILSVRRPEFVWPRLLRGFAASELGHKHQEEGLRDAEFAEFKIAGEDFDAVLKQDRTALVQYVGLANRGVLHFYRKRYADAVRDLREAVRIKPDGFPAHVNLARALKGLQRWEEALTALDQAIWQAPDLVLAVLYETRARVHLDRKDRPAALDDFEQAIALEADGQSEQLVNNLLEVGQLLHREHKEEKALASFDRALRLRPDRVLAQRYRAETLLALDRPVEAGKALDYYLAVTREPAAGVYQTRGLIHAGAGELSAAIDAYSAALRQDPRDTTTRRYRGWTYLLADAAQLAVEDFEACLRADRDSADALAGRGRARVRLGQLAGALEDASAVEKQGSLTVRRFFDLACIYAQAAALVETEARTNRSPLGAARVAFYEDRALKHLRHTLEELPAERRAAFWREQVQANPALAPIRRGTAYFQLARQYGNQGL